jgi:undecaprenyl-diphosphatase
MIALDERLFRLVNGLAGRWDWLDTAIVLLASDFFLPVLMAAGTWSLWFLGRSPTQRLANQLAFAYGAFGAGLANLLIRNFNQEFYRPRPFLTIEDATVLFYRPTDSSFPSNAAAFAFALAAGAWLGDRRVGVAVGVAAVLFSSARVVAGMHYPLDVLGGALVGILCAYVFMRLVALLRPLFGLMFRIARELYLT